MNFTSRSDKPKQSSDFYRYSVLVAPNTNPYEHLKHFRENFPQTKRWSRVSVPLDPNMIRW